MMNEKQRQKIGDVLCDIGKYMITVVPFSYFVSDNPNAIYILIGTAFFGFLFVLFGLYFIKNRTPKVTNVNSEKKKIKILKNTVFVVEEEHQ